MWKQILIGCCIFLNICLMSARAENSATDRSAGGDKAGALQYLSNFAIVLSRPDGATGNIETCGAFQWIDVPAQHARYYISLAHCNEYMPMGDTSMLIGRDVLYVAKGESGVALRIEPLCEKPVPATLMPKALNPNSPYFVIVFKEDTFGSVAPYAMQLKLRSGDINNAIYEMTETAEGVHFIPGLMISDDNGKAASISVAMISSETPDQPSFILGAGTRSHFDVMVKAAKAFKGFTEAERDKFCKSLRQP